MKRLILITVGLAFSVLVFGQNERKYIRNGNKLFMEAIKDTTKIDTVKFSNAETEYRKALNKKPTDLQWNYNLADALYKQQHFDDAANKFKDLGEEMKNPVEKARAYHNLGNSELMQQKIDESIESYKKALRENPSDLDTKYNLAYAQMLKKKQQQQQKQQNKNQDKNKDQNKDKNKQDQNKDQDKNKQDQNKQDQNKDQQKQNQDQQQQQQQQNKISKENAEQLLQALQNDEKDIQEKVKKEKAAQAKRTRVEKEW
jgi:tetratricopeptide (TPR) repeat protein